MSTTAAENVQATNPTANAFNEIIDFLVSELKVNNEKASALRSRVSDIINTLSPAKPEKKTTRKSKKDSPDAKQCQYEFGKRSKTPGQKCGGKVCEESTSGLYCKKHLKQEKTEEKESSKPATEKKEKKEKAPAKSAKSKNESKESASTAVQSLKDSAPMFTVKKNKFGNYAHEGTGFLFNRETQKVFGRQKPDGSIAPLVAEDIEACRSLGFSFDLPPNLTSKEDKTAESDEELESEEDNDDEEEEDVDE